jgi:Bifunctional DNA primase/polymerase, N-terminal
MASPAEILNFRISLQNAGFDPVPLAGKRALLPNWVAKRNVPKEEVAAWNASYPAWTNTGLLTGYCPALDSDIRDPDAAELLADTIRDWFDGRGVILTRFGEAPKFATLFRTDTPFAKFRVDLVGPNDEQHHIGCYVTDSSSSSTAFTRAPGNRIPGTATASREQYRAVNCRTRTSRNCARWLIFL